MLTRVGMRRICMGPWQASIWASSLKMSCAKDATTGSNRKGKDYMISQRYSSKLQMIVAVDYIIILPLLYLRKMAIVSGQILFSALVVKAGSTVQTIQRVSMTKVSTSELN